MKRLLLSSLLAISGVALSAAPAFAQYYYDNSQMAYSNNGSYDYSNGYYGYDQYPNAGYNNTYDATYANYDYGNSGYYDANYANYDYSNSYYYPDYGYGYQQADYTYPQQNYYYQDYSYPQGNYSYNYQYNENGSGCYNSYWDGYSWQWTSCAQYSAGSSSSSQQRASVSIQNFSFQPQTLTVRRGTTVIWTNNDNTTHTVTGDNGGLMSQTLNPGQSYSYTFGQAGIFSYHCQIHPHMTGTVQVTN